MKESTLSAMLRNPVNGAVDIGPRTYPWVTRWGSKQEHVDSAKQAPWPEWQWRSWQRATELLLPGNKDPSDITASEKSPRKAYRAAVEASRAEAVQQSLDPQLDLDPSIVSADDAYAEWYRRHMGRLIELDTKPRVRHDTANCEGCLCLLEFLRLRRAGAALSHQYHKIAGFPVPKSRRAWETEMSGIEIVRLVYGPACGVPYRGLAKMLTAAYDTDADVGDGTVVTDELSPLLLTEYGHQALADTERLAQGWRAKNVVSRILRSGGRGAVERAVPEGERPAYSSFAAYATLRVNDFGSFAMIEIARLYRGEQASTTFPWGEVGYLAWSTNDFYSSAKEAANGELISWFAVSAAVNGWQEAAVEAWYGVTTAHVECLQEWSKTADNRAGIEIALFSTPFYLTCKRYSPQLLIGIEAGGLIWLDEVEAVTWRVVRETGTDPVNRILDCLGIWKNRPDARWQSGRPGPLLAERARCVCRGTVRSRDNIWTDGAAVDELLAVLRERSGVTSTSDRIRRLSRDTFIRHAASAAAECGTCSTCKLGVAGLTTFAELELAADVPGTERDALLRVHFLAMGVYFYATGIAAVLGMVGLGACHHRGQLREADGGEERDAGQQDVLATVASVD